MAGLRDFGGRFGVRSLAETMEQLHNKGKTSPSLNKLSELLFKFAEQA